MGLTPHGERPGFFERLAGRARPEAGGGLAPRRASRFEAEPGVAGDMAAPGTPAPDRHPGPPQALGGARARPEAPPPATPGAAPVPPSVADPMLRPSAQTPTAPSDGPPAPTAAIAEPGLAAPGSDPATPAAPEAAVAPPNASSRPPADAQRWPSPAPVAARNDAPATAPTGFAPDKRLGTTGPIAAATAPNVRRTDATPSPAAELAVPGRVAGAGRPGHADAPRATRAVEPRRRPEPLAPPAPPPEGRSRAAEPGMAETVVKIAIHRVDVRAPAIAAVPAKERGRTADLPGPSRLEAYLAGSRGGR